MQHMHIQEKLTKQGFYYSTNSWLYINQFTAFLLRTHVKMTRLRTSENTKVKTKPHETNIFYQINFLKFNFNITELGNKKKGKQII